jgi:preprotein translocase subunit SecE
MLMARKTKTKKSQPPLRKQNRLVRYLRDTRAELRKVSWPSRQEALSLTRIVLIVTISMAVILGLLDWLFRQELRLLLEGNLIATMAAIVAVIAVISIFAVAGRRKA